jgi:endonuclease G
MPLRPITPLDSIQADTEVMDELKSLAAGKKKLPHVESLPGGHKDFARSLETLTTEHTGGPLRMTEAIILTVGRPSLLVQGGVIEEPTLRTWRDRLAGTKAMLEESVIPAVGRVELSNHPDFEWVGTGWRFGDDLLITNRHVAEEFATRRGPAFVKATNAFGQTIESRVDFREEFGGDIVHEIDVKEIVFVAMPNGPDMAVLKLAPHPDLPPPLTLAARDAVRRTPIGVIGYPAIDSQRNPIQHIRDIFKDIYDVKRFAPGEVMDTGDRTVLLHDASTMGGNSGSPVVALETGHVVGLHFSGRFGSANQAVKSSVIAQVLGGLRTARVTTGGGDGLVEGRTKAELETRSGYDENFFGAGHTVPLPSMTEEMEDDAVVVDRSIRGPGKFVLDYTHFSVVMKKSDKQAYFTAVNIDGKKFVGIRGRPSWIRDPRIPAEDQIGDEVYGGPNKVDRGHLVRRLDPCWGTQAEAKQANDDTHVFTNACPQQHTFNDGPWGDLEDYLLDGSKNDKQKLTVFTGPVFGDGDIRFKGARMPSEFWKVAVALGPNDKLVATAYVVSQVPFLDDLEFIPGRFRTFQISVRKLEEKTGLDFGRLKQADPLDGTESLGSPAIRLNGPEDIVM